MFRLLRLPVPWIPGSHTEVGGPTSGAECDTDRNAGYYASLFPSLQQKDRSGFLTYLWQTDPFKAKWAILAKAYSIIRDTIGKENVPLEKFLAINGPLLGIVEPTNYLDFLGWEIATDDDSQTILRRGADADAVDQSLIITNISVDDVVGYSIQQGLIVEGIISTVSPRNEAAMASSAQHPVSNVQPAQSSTISKSGQSMSDDRVFTIEERKDGKLVEESPLPFHDQADI